MSVIKFQVTEDHLKLVKYLQFSIKDNHLSTNRDENDEDYIPKPNAFGEEDLHSDIGIIIFGRPANFDPMSTELSQYSEQDKEYMDKLWGDIPTVLELKCYFDHLVPGTYKRKFHDRDWKKIS